MTEQAKTFEQRLVDGFKDYFADIESFDGRYVCGQLFLYGEAKAYDIGIPDSYPGDDLTRIRYMLNWTTSLWDKSKLLLTPLITNAERFDGIKNTVMVNLPNLNHGIEVEQYVSLLIKLVEVKTTLGHNQALFEQYQTRILELLESPSYKHLGFKGINNLNLLAHFIKELDVAYAWLSKDYDGEHLYPTATLTFLSTTDQLNNTLSTIKNLNYFNLIEFQTTSLFKLDMLTTLSTAFGNYSKEQIKEYKVYELLVLLVSQLKLLKESVKDVEATIALSRSLIKTLKSEKK